MRVHCSLILLMSLSRCNLASSSLWVVIIIIFIIVIINIIIIIIIIIGVAWDQRNGVIIIIMMLIRKRIRIRIRTWSALLLPRRERHILCYSPPLSPCTPSSGWSLRSSSSLPLQQLIFCHKREEGKSFSISEVKFQLKPHLMALKLKEFWQIVEERKCCNKSWILFRVICLL